MDAVTALADGEGAGKIHGADHGRPELAGSNDFRPRERALWHYRTVASTDLDRLAQTAYEAHRTANPGHAARTGRTPPRREESLAGRGRRGHGPGRRHPRRHRRPRPVDRPPGRRPGPRLPHRVHRGPAGLAGHQRRPRLQPPRPLPARPRLLVRRGSRLHQRHLAQQPPHLRRPAPQARQQGQDRPHPRRHRVRLSPAGPAAPETRESALIGLQGCPIDADSRSMSFAGRGQELRPSSKLFAVRGAAVQECGRRCWR